jgi:hypothetical protein
MAAAWVGSVAVLERDCDVDADAVLVQPHDSSSCDGQDTCEDGHTSLRYRQRTEQSNSKSEGESIASSTDQEAPGTFQAAVGGGREVRGPAAALGDVGHRGGITAQCCGADPTQAAASRVAVFRDCRWCRGHSIKHMNMSEAHNGRGASATAMHLCLAWGSRCSQALKPHTLAQMLLVLSQDSPICQCASRSCGRVAEE